MTSLTSTSSMVTRRFNLRLSYLFIIGIFIFSFIDKHHGLSEDIDLKNTDPLAPLKNKCFDTAHIPSWWSYVWCFRDDIRQMHIDGSENVIQSHHFIGKFVPSESHSQKQIYRHNISDCQSISGLSLLRYADVVISCCRDENWSSMHDRFESIAGLGTFIESVTEASECEYHLKVCSDLVCPKLKHKDSQVRGTKDVKVTIRSNALKHDSLAFGFSNFLKDQIHRSRNVHSDIFISEADQSSNLDRVRQMFYHGYDMYMKHAQPESELRPLSCDGGPFELVKLPLLTLIDTLDTLVIMGNHTEFRRAVEIVCLHYEAKLFDMDVNVSVFETTIRVLGGLLAAHLMAIDPLLGIYRNFGSRDFGGDYDNQLLRLALDVGERLLPAFATPTGIPYGTVNLRYGVPEGETEIASTAGAGSLLLELETLSALSRDTRFGDAAFTAVQALYSRRSYLGLLGKHIHTSNGQWHESSSGIGSNADSFYEYLLKGHLLFHRHSLFSMFDDTYHAVKRHIQVGDWFTEVDMFNGKSRRNRVENLQAFWPGMESVLGLCSSAARLLNAFYAVWLDIGFLPEEFDQAAWLDKRIISNSWYPLRPELIESTYHQYRSTGDRTWLSAGSVFLDAVENNTKTDCGYASVSNIATLQLTNNMPSFFLSETCKYLYLLFDEGNFIHDRPYIFTTEAHPFDPLQLPLRSNLKSGVIEEQFNGKSPNLLPLKCIKGLWWDSGTVAYDAEYLKNQQIRRTGPTSKSAQNTASASTRRITTAVNSVNVAALLSASSLPSAADNSDTKLDTLLYDWPLAGVRRSDTCYDSDIKNISPTSVTIETIVDQQKRQSSPQKVTVYAESMGEFTVTMYPDGFMVVSKDHGDKLEITNVGESFVFVGYQLAAAQNSRSKTIIGDQTGKTVVCTVALVNRDGERIEGDEDRSCSIATFGPSSIPSSPVIADLYVPGADNVMVCKPIEPFVFASSSSGSSSSSSSSTVEKGQGQTDDPVEVLEHITSTSWWREWPSASSISSMLSRGLSKPFSSRGQKSGSTIVLARRGNCLFEDKTLVAQTAGARAIIIANNEDYLFVMSGKKLVNSENESKQPDGSISVEETLSEEEDANTTIPTVMITKSDSESMIKLLSSLSENYESSNGAVNAKVRIDFSSFPSMLDGVFMGGLSYPKLRVGKNIVHVIGGDTWGVVLNSLNGREWQLYIMSAVDVAASMCINPWDAVTPGGQPVSISYTGAIKPLDLYRNVLSRSCPLHLNFDGDKVIFNNMK